MTLKAYRDHSMMLEGRVCQYMQITRHGCKVKSAVKLTNGKAAEVGRVYLVRSVTVAEGNGSSWVFCSPDEGAMFYYQTSNYAREGDIVVFATVPGNHVYYKSTNISVSDSARK